MCLRSAWLALALGLPMAAQQPVTRIHIGDRVLQRQVKRFGINLSGQNFYDSGQMLRNLIARNPGFEGETWQSIVRCASLDRTGCTLDEDVAWPAGFMDGAVFEVMTGAAAGAHGMVRASARAGDRYTLAFTAALPRAAGKSFLSLRIGKPGDPLAGWWPDLACGSTATAELQDLPPGSASHQALRLHADRPCQRAIVTSYFDSLGGHSFVRLNGPMTMRFRARPIAGNGTVRVRMEREGTPAFMDRTLSLQPGWHEYTVAFRAVDRAGSTGTVGIGFTVEGATLLLDDVSLTADDDPANGTAFRPEVVAALRDLHPGILRYMDSGTDFGTSLDTWLSPPNGRARTGYSTHDTRQQDVSLGLHEFLQLAEAVGAEPWISLPLGFSTGEARNLIEYLSGSPQTRYGGIRAALGHPTPWDGVFATMHLELGNEAWNRASFAGAVLDDPAAYGQRARDLFQVMRGAAGFRASRYDLIAGSFAEVPDITGAELRALGGAADTVAVAPYLFSHFNTAPGMEGVYGPMLAQPEQMDGTGGTMELQAAAAHAAGKRLAVYEVNLGTLTGAPTVTQAAIDRTVPTIGAAIATVDHMLLMLRDLGITDQCFFALPEFANGFTSDGNAGPPRTTPLYGAVVDMGGLTNRRRPSFLALRLLNHALLPNLVETIVDGANPTWTQPLSTNDNIALAHAHLLQSFAFADGKRRSAVVLNLSRSRSLPISFAGSNAPRGTVDKTTLTSAHIEDSNELQGTVAPQTTVLHHVDPAATHLLPPFSLTTFTWTTP